MTEPGTTHHRIIGYLAGWSADETLFERLDTVADRLTHINYAFGLIGDDGRAILGQPEEDIERAVAGDDGGPDGLRGNFRQLQLLKEQHPHLQTLISIGGWTGSGRFSDAASTPEGREALVASTIELFLTRWPGVFDGIDIDWEYPVMGGLPENSRRPEDRRNCILLFEEYRRQLDALGAETGKHYPLTAALPAGRELPLATFEIGEIATILDWINVMTYDINGSHYSGITSHNAALRPSTTDPREMDEFRFLNVEGTVQSFLAEGVTPDRLVVGVPFYGRGYRGVPEENNGLYQPFSDMFFANYHVLVDETLQTAERHWHDEAGVPWLYDADSGSMVSYEDPESIAGKAAYIVEHGLGGAMFWELTGDDTPWSLLTALSENLHRGAPSASSPEGTDSRKPE
jgi:chitinase